jgi:hypothetical protein
VQNKAAKFAQQRNDFYSEILAHRRKCTWGNGYGRPYISDTLQNPSYLSWVDHDRKIRNVKQKADVGNYSFVNRMILWNQLPAYGLGTLLYTKEF